MIILPDLTEEKFDDRIVLIDADCVAYYGAAGCDDMPSLSAFRRVDLRMEQIFNDCQTENYESFLTGNTNFRDRVATLERYKGNRYDKEGNRIKSQPNWLPECKQYLIENYKAKVSIDQEADDDISIRCTDLTKTGDKKVFISSLDKDLMINSCMHHNQMNGEITCTSGDGEVHMDKGKCKGHGLKFFYAQMLMGDTADCIPGLPRVTEYMKQTFSLNRLGGCGPASAFKIINPCSTAVEAELAVIKCYASYWSKNGYTSWKGVSYTAGKKVFLEQLLEQGRLLWMRSTENEAWLPITSINKLADIYEEVTNS